MKPSSGFTLIEIAITLVIILVLAVVLVPLTVGFLDQARAARAQSDVRSIGEALLTADPWGRKYLVNIINAKTSSTSAVLVVSAGPDGVLQTFFNPLRTSTTYGGVSADDLVFRIR